MASVRIAVILMLVVAVTAWPLKPDDKELRMKECEATSVKDLDAFNLAWTAKDQKKLAELTDDIINVLVEAQDNNVKLNRKMKPVIRLLDELSKPRRLLPIKFLRTRALSLLTNILDGNRDNLSYYRLESVRLWLEKRMTAEVAESVPEFVSAKTHVTAARDALEEMASTFVSGLKTVKDESGHIIGTDHDAIRDAIVKIVETADANSDVLVQETDKTQTALENAAREWWSS